MLAQTSYLKTPFPVAPPSFATFIGARINSSRPNIHTLVMREDVKKATFNFICHHFHLLKLLLNFPDKISSIFTIQWLTFADRWCCRPVLPCIRNEAKLGKIYFLSRCNIFDDPSHRHIKKSSVPKHRLLSEVQHFKFPRRL